MDLSTLPGVLKAQAKQNNTVTIDKSTFNDANLTLEPGFDSLLQKAFSITGPLQLTVSPGDIPESPTDNSLSFQGSPKGKVLNQEAPITCTVSIIDGPKVQVILSMPLTNWKFSDSFTYLDVYPFDILALDKETFIFSNLENYKYSWNNKAIRLEPGLNFSSMLTLTGFPGAIRLLKDIVAEGSASVFSGTVDPSTIKLDAPGSTTLYPETNLTSTFSDTSFSIGGSLNVARPGMALRISGDEGIKQTIWMLLTLDILLKKQGGVNWKYVFEAGLLPDDSTLTLGIVPDPNQTPSLEDLAEWSGGATLGDLIPKEFETIFKHITLKGFSASLSPKLKVISVGFVIGSTGPWTIVEEPKLVLDNIDLRLSVIDPFGSKILAPHFAATLEFFPSLFHGVFEIEVTEDLSIYGTYQGYISVNDLVSTISDHSVTVPPDFEMTFSDFALAFKKNKGKYDWSLFGQASVAFDLAILGSKLKASLAARISSTSGKKSYLLEGGLTLGNNYFQASLDIGDTSKVLKASWKALSSKGYLQIQDMLNDLKLEMPTIPEGLDLALESASFSYDFTHKTLVLKADSVNYGKAVFVALKNKEQKWQFFFGLAVDKTINLSNLPVIDKVLDKQQTLEVRQIQVVISSKVIDKELAGNINNMIDKDYPRVPLEGMPGGVALSMEFDFGGQVVPISIGTGGGGQNEQDKAGNGQANIVIGAASGQNTGTLPVPQSASSDGTTWFDIQKSFGPVNFRKVGVKYADSVLWFLLDASISMAGLTISVKGLSVGSPLKNFEPQFNIEGLGIDYRNAAVEIGGNFLKTEPIPPVTLEFGGSAVIKAETFSIEAIGAYADVGGQMSMFIFASVTGAFGGPPSFFITGFAGGFGYNSKLRLPAQDEIFQFPFVAGLTNPESIGGKHPTPLQVLEKLMGDGSNPGWITPRVGDMWLAAGIQFTSFNLVNTSALLIVQFGSDITLALIGLSKARFPMEGRDVYAYVELQLGAIFEPAKGQFSFTAVLSPNSYVIDPACHLTGGFAMYFWFGDNPHAGDFVLTLGGYSPYFDVPAWYPREPRLGFNWSLDSHVSITGGAYFALTPSALMAGGALDVNYHSGNLNAWFNAQADIVIWWNPFHFLADIGVSVGASYKVDLLFISKTYKVELSADLTLWGPPTGGTVTVHWWAISFTIDFGAGHSNSIIEKQEWDQFKKILPGPEEAVKIIPVNGIVPQPQKQDTTNDQTPRSWLVRSDNFQFIIDSAIPAYQLLYVREKRTSAVKTGNKLNIRPMQKTNLISLKRLYIKKNGTEVDLLDSKQKWQIEVITRDVPKALWGTGSNTSLVSGNDQLVKNQLTGLKLTAPSPQLGNTRGGIDIENNLSYVPLEPGKNPLQTDLPPVGPLPGSSTRTISYIGQIMSSGVKTRRDNIHKALQELRFDTVPNGDLNHLVEQAGSSFVDEPLLIETKK